MYFVFCKTCMEYILSWIYFEILYWIECILYFVKLPTQLPDLLIILLLCPLSHGILNFLSINSITNDLIKIYHMVNRLRSFLSSSHLVILTSGHPDIRSSHHPFIRSSAHPVIRSFRHSDIWSFGHPVIRSSHHHVIISQSHKVFIPLFSTCATN